MAHSESDRCQKRRHPIDFRASDRDLFRFFAGVLNVFGMGGSKCIWRAYLTDVSDEESAFVLPYLLLSREDNASRQHDLWALFDAARYIVKTGNQWRLMPHDIPPWPAAYQQVQRWLRAGCFVRRSAKLTLQGVERAPRADPGLRVFHHLLVVPVPVTGSSI
jgi:transposase